jgi:hypothetical protein
MPVLTGYGGWICEGEWRFKGEKERGGGLSCF